MGNKKPNTSYLETYFEVVSEMERRSDALYEALPGTGGRWEFAEELTDMFELIHQDTDWDNDPKGWMETLEEFLYKQLKSYPPNITA